MSIKNKIENEKLNIDNDYFEIDLSESEKLKDEKTIKYLNEIKDNKHKGMLIGAFVFILLLFAMLVSFNVGR